MYIDLQYILILGISMIKTSLSYSLNSANSLFALPNNQAYVYIMEESQEEVPAASLINKTLHKLCSLQGMYIDI